MKPNELQVTIACHDVKNPEKFIINKIKYNSIIKILTEIQFCLQLRRCNSMFDHRKNLFRGPLYHSVNCLLVNVVLLGKSK